MKSIIFRPKITWNSFCDCLNFRSDSFYVRLLCIAKCQMLDVKLRKTALFGSSRRLLTGTLGLGCPNTLLSVWINVDSTLMTPKPFPDSPLIDPFLLQFLISFFGTKNLPPKTGKETGSWTGFCNVWLVAVVDEAGATGVGVAQTASLSAGFLDCLEEIFIYCI